MNKKLNTEAVNRMFEAILTLETKEMYAREYGCDGLEFL